MNHLYIPLFEKIIAFVERTEDISCLAIIGSQVSRYDLSDKYSDLDLLIVTKNKDQFYSNDEWLEEIDETWISFTESVPEANFYERRVIFKNGLEVDFVLVEEEKLKSPKDKLPILKDICNESTSIIIDKSHIQEYLLDFFHTEITHGSPTQTEFSTLVNDFYFHYLWTYKKVLRGELWVALQCINSYLKIKILRMLEWYEHGCHGSDYNTFYEGRHIEEWLNKDFLHYFQGLFSIYEPGEMKSVLRKNVDFFNVISHRTAKVYNFILEENGKNKLIKWIDHNYPG